MAGPKNAATTALANIDDIELNKVSLDDLSRILARLDKPTLDRLFEEVRAKLRHDCVTRGTARTFHPAFSEAMLSRLKGSDADYPSSGIQRIYKERLLWYYQLPRQTSLYRQIADLIGQEEGDREMIVKRYAGEYRYFRYAARANDDPKYANGKPIYVMGKIKIEEQRGEPVFGHWSHDYDMRNPVPEHWGMVFRIDKTLYLPARGDNMMRLSAARRAGRHEPIVMPGITLSMRNTPTNDPFAARFLLVLCNDENRDLIAELDPDLPGAEGRFRERMKANKHDHYMLID